MIEIITALIGLFSLDNLLGYLRESKKRRIARKLLKLYLSMVALRAEGERFVADLECAVKAGVQDDVALKTKMRKYLKVLDEFVGAFLDLSNSISIVVPGEHKILEQIAIDKAVISLGGHSFINNVREPFFEFDAFLSQSEKTGIGTKHLFCAVLPDGVLTGDWDAVEGRDIIAAYAKYSSQKNVGQAFQQLDDLGQKIIEFLTSNFEPVELLGEVEDI